MESGKIDRTFLTYLALFSATVFWGLSFVATKVALESFPVFTLIFFRLGLGAGLFLVFFLRLGFPKFSRPDHKSLFLIALFEPGLYFVFETIGLQYTTAPKASLIIATIPIVVLILAYFFLRERSTPAGFLGIVISLLGIGVLTTGDSQFRLAFGGQFSGDLLIFRLKRIFTIDFPLCNMQLDDRV
jgi:drug/metabolite transporter (DMT)-like permease